jgi:hypothetical protein
LPVQALAVAEVEVEVAVAEVEVEVAPGHVPCLEAQEAWGCHHCPTAYNC